MPAAAALRQPRRKARRAPRLQQAGIAALVFAAGFGIGRWAAGPTEEHPPAAPALSRTAAPAEESVRPTARPAALAPQPISPAPRPDQENAGRSLSESAENPGEIFGAVIDALRDDEILAVLATATDMNAEELRGVRDPRALARRMSQIAVGDLLSKPGEHPPNLGRVYFSEQRGRQEADGEAATFTGKEPIIARFANDDYRDGRVFMKWTRTEGPEIVLFRPFPVKFTSHYSEIELRSESALPPGRYKVAFYSDDERMQPVASGHYFIASEESD